MSYRVIVAIATEKAPIYNGRIVEAAEVILDDESLQIVDERRVLDAGELRQADAFSRRRATATLHSFGRFVPVAMSASPWEIPPGVWGECIRDSVRAVMADIGEAASPARVRLSDAARYFGIQDGDGTSLGSARAAAKIYAEVLRLRREDEFVQGEARMVMNDGW